MRRLLFKVFGWRVACLFGSVCFLSVAVLAALYLFTGYGLEAYVSDQLRRLPTDITVLQSAEVQTYKVLFAPVAGRLRWLVAEHMALSVHRIAGVLFLTALATSMALLPQIAADTFYGRVLRGVRDSIGSDVQLEFSLTNLTGGEDAPAPVPKYRELVRAPLAALEAELRRRPDVTGVTPILQFMIPGFYLPAQSGLLVNLVEDPSAYRRMAYFEDGLGMTRPLAGILESLRLGSIAVSRGLLRVRKVPLDQDIELGYVNDYDPIRAQFHDVVAFLPGQPSIDVAQREGYAAAELDYLNYVMSSDARVIASVERFNAGPLSALKVLPSRAVLLLKTRSKPDQEMIDWITTRLPVAAESVRWEGTEREKIGKDMFVSLALENMKVFMIGGLVISLAGVFVMGLANFISERRNFSLLRLRGLPFALILRFSLAMFLVPVLVGIVFGSLLGAISAYGIAQAIWELPRVYGVAGFLENRLVISPLAYAIAAGFAVALSLVAVIFALWPLRKTAREAIKEA